MMKEKIDLCSNCVNWLEHSKNLISCDYEHFEKIPLEQAIIFVPEIFDCEEFEQIEKN